MNISPTVAKRRLLQRLRAASKAAQGRRNCDPLLTALAFAARDKLLISPRAKAVQFEGVKFPVATGAVLVTAMDPETYTPLVSALRNIGVSV
ncbi:MAG: hypothetical protein FIA96_11160 [Betaproteobacteria bacterium]|nr:hypothetical protein [Betaproteobacteria bacterium]